MMSLVISRFILDEKVIIVLINWNNVRVDFIIMYGVLLR